MKQIIFLFLAGLLLIAFSKTNLGKELQSREMVYLSMYLPVSEHTDLKFAQITYTDGEPVKTTLTAFNYSILGTTAGYVNPLGTEMYLGYRNPDNTIPIINEETMEHEVFHLAEIHHDFKRYCIFSKNNPEGNRASECRESKADEFNHLKRQMRLLEERGWLVIQEPPL